MKTNVSAIVSNVAPQERSGKPWRSRTADVSAIVLTKADKFLLVALSGLLFSSTTLAMKPIVKNPSQEAIDQFVKISEIESDKTLDGFILELATFQQKAQRVLQQIAEESDSEKLLEINLYLSNEWEALKKRQAESLDRVKKNASKAMMEAYAFLHAEARTAGEAVYNTVKEKLARKDRPVPIVEPTVKPSDIPENFTITIDLF